MNTNELELQALYYKAVSDYRKQGENGHEEGFYFLKEAADRGHIEATKMLGVLYMSGQYAPFPEKDVKTAILCYEAAAEDGDEEAMYWLSQCYEMGMGVEKDPDMADKWRIRALANGFVPASEEDEECGYDELRPKKVQPPKELTEEEAEAAEAAESAATAKDEAAKATAEAADMRGLEEKEPESEKSESEVPKGEESESEEPESEEPETEESESGEPESEVPEGEEPEDEGPKDEELKDEEPEDEGPKDEGPKDEEPEEEESNEPQGEVAVNSISAVDKNILLGEAREAERIRDHYDILREAAEKRAWQAPLKQGLIYGLLALMIWLVLWLMVSLIFKTRLGEQGSVIFKVAGVLVSLAALAIGGLVGAREGIALSEKQTEYELSPLFAGFRWPEPLSEEQEWLKKTYRILSRAYEPVSVWQPKMSEDAGGWLLPGWFFQTDKGGTRPEFVILTRKALYVVRAMQVKGRLSGTLKDLEWTLRIDSEVRQGLDAMMGAAVVPGSVDKLLNMVDENAFGSEIVLSEICARGGKGLGDLTKDRLPVVNVLLFGPSVDIRGLKLVGAPENLVVLQGDAGKLQLAITRIENHLADAGIPWKDAAEGIRRIGLYQLRRDDLWEQQ